jgi:hypothetical protein
MKTSEITSIIEDNPQQIFVHASRTSYFTIEGFTEIKRYGSYTPTKVAITRSVYISLDANGKGTISEAKNTSHTTFNQIWSTGYENAEMLLTAHEMKFQQHKIKERQKAITHAKVADLCGQFKQAFADHNIQTTWGSISSTTEHLTLTLTPEQAQTLLNLIKA